MLQKGIHAGRGKREREREHGRQARGRNAGSQASAEAEARRVVDAYADDVLRLAYAYLRSRADAEDVCQEVLLKLLSRGGRFESPEHERAWVVRCAINASKDQLRSAARRTTAPLEAAGEPADPTTWDDGSPGWQGPDAAASAGADGRVAKAVLALPVAYREAVHLHYYEGMSIKHAAEVAGTSEDAMAKRLSRARAMLRQSLGGDGNGEE